MGSLWPHDRHDQARRPGATLSATALLERFEYWASDEETVMTVRDGSAEWHGDVRSGSGEITVGDGVFQGPYSFASRFKDGEGPTRSS